MTRDRRVAQKSKHGTARELDKADVDYLTKMLPSFKNRLKVGMYLVTLDDQLIIMENTEFYRDYDYIDVNDE